MTPELQGEARRAHLALHNQTLMDEWHEVGKLWAEGRKLLGEGDKLQVEGRKLCAEGSKLWDEGDKLYAEGDKLYAEGRKLWGEGDKLWAQAVQDTFGNIAIKWVGMDCHLGNGEVYIWEGVI